MALAVKDRVRETSTTAGTGTLTLAGAVSGFQAFSVIGDANTTYYGIVDSTTGAFEVGIGTYTLSGTTLSRTTVLSSSNAGSLVNFAANSKDVFVTYPSSKSVYYDASSNLPVTGALNVTSASATSLAVGLTGATNPAFTVDSSTASQVAGLKVTGAATGGTVAVVATDSGSNTNLTVNAKGTGTIGIGSVSTGLVTITPNTSVTGAVGIGATSLTAYNLRVSKTITGGTLSFGIVQDSTIQSDVTSQVYGYRTALATQAAAFTLSSLFHVAIEQGTFGATSAVTNQYGVIIGSTLTGATNNYGFFGNIAAGTGRFNAYMQGTANNFFAGSVGIGTASLTGVNFAINKNVTGALTSYGMYSLGAIQSDVTADARYYTTNATTQATVFTLGSLKHYAAVQGTFGAGSVVTDQYGFHADSTLTGATTNYGFYSNIASGAGRWNFYAAGTANNYMAGSLGIGTTGLTGYSLHISKTLTGVTTTYGIANELTVQSDVTANAYGYGSTISTQAAAFTLGSLYHISIEQGTIGATSAVTNQYGVIVKSSLTGATNNYGFYSNIASGTGRYNLYMAGTAENFLNGLLTVRSSSANAFTVGLNAATNPAFTVDSSTALQVAGFKVTGAVTGGTVALVATDSGANTSLTFNAKGTGTISIGSVSSGNMIFGGTVSATRRVEFDTSGTGTFAQGNNALTTNIVLQNLDTSSTTNHGSSMVWKTCTNAAATAINSGRIAVLKEQLWTSTASTQDSAMTFATTLDGTLTERMRITSGGLVGIGTTTPTQMLEIKATNQTGFVGAAIQNNNSNIGIAGTQFSSDATYYKAAIGLLRSSTNGVGSIVFYNDSNTDAADWATTDEKMRIDSSGRVGIGTTSSTYGLSVNSATGINSYDGVAGKGRYVLGDPADSTGYIGMYRSTAATIGTAGNALTLAGYDAIAFTTGAAAFASQTERMRIDSGGNLLVNATSTSPTSGAGVKITGAFGAVASRARVSIVTAESTSATSGLSLYSTGAGAYRFYIDDNGDGYITNTTWNAISDSKLKENIRDVGYGVDEIMQLRPRMYDWKAGEGQDKKDCIGFIAQEMQSVFPEFVKKSKNVDSEGVPYLTVGAADLIPVLVKAIQQQQLQIEALNSRVLT